MPDETPTGSRRARVIFTWTVANLALGCLATVPVLLIVAAGVPVAVATVLVNRALRRRLGARRWAALAFWAATSAVLLAPFLVFVIFPDLSTVIF